MSAYILRPDEMLTGRQGEVITAAAVGSGIVVCLYDEQTKAGGMCYLLGPESGKKIHPMHALLDSLTAWGIPPERLWAKVIGGATIFCLESRIGDKDAGKKTAEYVRKRLQKLEIPIRAEDTGNNFGRTVSLDFDSGNVRITLANRHVYDI